MLQDYPGLNFGEAALNGGPLGELVQWSDLIASLHLLGHNVVLSWSTDKLQQLVGKHDLFEGCITQRKFDLVFTDYSGLSQVRHTNSLQTNLKISRLSVKPGKYLKVASVFLNIPHK